MKWAGGTTGGERERIENLLRIIKEKRTIFEKPGVERVSEPAFKELCRYYREASKSDSHDTRLCVFTGAGVSAMKTGRFGTPGWTELLEGVYQKIVAGAKGKGDFPPFIRLKEECKSAWDVADFLQEKTDERTLKRFIREEIQKWSGRDTGHKGTPYKRLPRSYLNRQTTLNATVAFCSSLTGIHKYPCYQPNLAKIRAVLTLNYDWYLEGGATTKYQRRLPFKPIARFNSKPFEGKLPVYHIHGYLPYARDEEPQCELILSSSQYKKAYEQEEGFLRKHLDFFFTRYPTVFIGVSFDDLHFLNHLGQLSVQNPALDHFALFKKNDIPHDRLKEIEEVRVRPIFFEDFASIPRILGEIYREGLRDASFEHLPGSLDLLGRGDYRNYWSLLLYNKR